MSKLIYIANVSLDGYIEDAEGNFDWTTPSDDYFVFITDLVRSSGTYLYGRRLYETMAVWETDPAVAAESELRSDFAQVWQAANKVVYSTTLHEVSTAQTRIACNFDPDAVRELKDIRGRRSHRGRREPRRARFPEPGSSTSVTCSSVLCSSAGASRRFLTTRAPTSSCSMNGSSAMVSYTSATAYCVLTHRVFGAQSACGNGSAVLMRVCRSAVYWPE